MNNPDTLPLWLALPLIVLLYGYFAADALVRRANRRRSVHTLANPAAMSLHGAENRGANHHERQQADDERSEQSSSDPGKQRRRKEVHAFEGIAS